MTDSDMRPVPDGPDRIDTAQINRDMAKGAGWMIAMQFGVRAIGLVSTVILARLLVPEDFGLVALATMLFGALEIMAAFSFDLALIRDQQAERAHYDTVWTLTVARGLAMAVLLAASASLAAGFFDEPRLEPLLYWLALAAVVTGFENVGVVQFRKEMAFGREFRYRLAIKLSAFFVTLALALLWRNYWALIGGIVASRVVQVAMSYYLHPFRPRPAISRAGDILHFSKWLAINNILLFITNRADTFIIGKITGVERVGLYNVAYEVSNLPTTELVWPIQRAIFPGYAKLSGDHASLRTAYLNVLALALMIGAPVGVGIGLVADPLVKVFLGATWVEATPIIQILAIFGVIRLGMANAGSVFLAMGKPRVLTGLASIGISIKIPLLIWGTMTDGAVGAAWALTASACISLTLSLTTVSHHLKLRPADIFSGIWRTLVAVGLMAATVSAAESAWPNPQAIHLAILHLIALVVIGAFTYVAALLGAWRLSGCPNGAEQQLLKTLRFKYLRKRAA